MSFPNFWIAVIIFSFFVLHEYPPEDRAADAQINTPEAYAWILDDDHASVEIGNQQGPDNSFFGSIDNVLVQDTIVHVLDQQQKQLSATTFSGRRLAEIGSEGQGPNEFMRPHALVEGNEERVVVYDMLGTLKHFEFTYEASEPHYRLYDTRDFLRRVSNLCRTEDNLFVYPSNEPGVPTTEREGDKHLLAYLPFTFDDADTELSHFGARPSFMENVPDQFMYRVSQGKIHCTAHDRVLASHLLSSVIDIYDSSGQKIGTIHFESLQSPTFEVVRYDGRDMSTIHYDDAYEVSSMVSLDARHMLVQFAYHPVDWAGRNANEPLEQHTYVLNIRDQEATLLGTTETIFHHVTDSQYVASANVTQPMIYVGSKQ